MELSWANIVQQYHHEDGRAWADIVEDDNTSEHEVVEVPNAVLRNDGRTWADVVGKATPDHLSASEVDSDEEQPDAVPGDPVGIRAIQSILMSATQMSLSHFHTAGMGTTAVSSRQVPSAADAMNSVYTKYNTSMQFECSDDVYDLRKHIVGARLSSFLLTVGSNLTGLPDRENVWYEVLGVPLYDGNLIRFYIDFNKMRNHGLTLRDLARQSFGDDIAVNISPDFMGMIDIEVPDDYLSQWLSRTDRRVCGTFDIQSCDKINESTAMTRGTNILAVLRAPGVDNKTITSNNVSEVEKYFGVEAAAQVLFQLTGSRIVSDFMARTGKVLSFIKNSTEVRKKGLLTSMGFERPKDDIKRQFTTHVSHALTFANTRESKGPSVYESIITGVDPVGCFEAMTL